LVDTSVIVDSFKGADNEKVELFRQILKRGMPFGISAYTFQEVLQGARDEREYVRLKDYLSNQKIYCIREEIDIYEKAARLFFDLRRKGITIRSSIDILISLTAIENDLYLLCNDGDFHKIKTVQADLKILERLM